MPESGPVCVFGRASVPRQSVATETTAERHAARLPKGIDGLSDVTCDQAGEGFFDCDGVTLGSGIAFRLTVGRFFFIRACSITKLFRVEVPLGCQHVMFDVDFMESEAKELSRGGIGPSR